MRAVHCFVPALCLVSVFACSVGAQTNDHLLFRNPSISATQIVFEYANDLWIVPSEGREARRLTNGVGHESDPHFSPDGTQIAFTAEYEGNLDVYVVPAAGGTPRRLTYHPGVDTAVGWTPDGKSILFNSRRESFADSGKLYTIAIDGTTPVALPLPIYNRENWNPELQASLTQPGVNVVAGEYLLAVRGRELHASENIYSFFQETAGKQTALRVGTNPDGSGSRDVTVVPVENEAV